MTRVTLRVEFPTLVTLDRVDANAMLTAEEIAAATATAWQQLHQLTEVAGIVCDYARPNLKHQYGVTPVQS